MVPEGKGFIHQWLWYCGPWRHKQKFLAFSVFTHKLVLYWNIARHQNLPQDWVIHPPESSVGQLSNYIGSWLAFQYMAW
jgi:hypothetical protein